MGTILEGKPVADALFGVMAERVSALKENGAAPTLKIIRVGERGDDMAYERSILKACERAGITAVSRVIGADAEQGVIIDEIEKSNADASVHGIMILKPLPKQMSEEAVSAALSPAKDVDCISEANTAKVFTGTASLYPCTPQAVVTLLKHYEIPLRGRHIVVCGRGMVVGKPLSMLLLSENATVTVCHSKTEHLDWHTKNADIVVAAIGRADFFGKEYFTDKSVVVDVGVNYDAQTGKLCGDVDFESVKGFINAVTPPKGGVGAVTTATLLSNTISACETQCANRSKT